MILTRELVNKHRTALRRIEKEAHRYAEFRCNGGPEQWFAGRYMGRDNTYHPRYFKPFDPFTDEGEEIQEQYESHLMDRVHKAIGATDPIEGLFINGDPRGYALKVQPEFAGDLHKDWGGYGILAPEEN